MNIEMENDSTIPDSGLKRIRCPQGITERDINTFFQHLGQDVTAEDREVHERALQLLRIHETLTFSNAELTVVGQTAYVCFLAGKGRRKFRVEPLLKKIKLQVHVENLFFGFLRLMLCLAALLEVLAAILSLAAVQNQQDGERAIPTTVTVVSVLNETFRLCLGCLVAMDTINYNSALFSPLYGGLHDSDGVGSSAEGLRMLGRYRWLLRGVFYATLLAANHPLQLQSDCPLNPATLQNVLMFSRWLLMLTSPLAVLLQALHVFIPSLLKAPWSSTAWSLDHSSSSALPTAKATIGTGQSNGNQDNQKNNFAGSTVQLNGFHASEDDLSRDILPFQNGSASHSYQGRPQVVNVFLRSTSVFICLGTALALFILHLIRLVQSTEQISTLNPAEGTLHSAVSSFLCAIAVGCQGIIFLQNLGVPMPILALGFPLSFILQAAVLSTIWSIETVSWLTQEVGLSMERTATVLLVGSSLALLVPAICMTAAQVMTVSHRPGTPLEVFRKVCCLGDISWDDVRRVLFMLAVLLTVSGMGLAILVLPLPMARVRAEYKGSLKDTILFADKVYDAIENHWDSLQEFLTTDICGGPDVASAASELRKINNTVSGLSVAQLRQHCDSLGWQEALDSQDPLCKKYAAASLYLADQIDYDSRIHDQEIRDIKSASLAARNTYLEGIIEASRATQIRSMETAMVQANSQTCEIVLCVAQNAALVAMFLPFVGIAARLAYRVLLTMESIFKLLTRLSTLQTVFLEFKVWMEMTMNKFRRYEEDKDIQFSLMNFDLIYLSYPILLSGLVVILVGFWYRKGVPASHRRRASLLVLLPLLLLNIFGLSATFVWTEIVTVLGDAAPLLRVVVTPLPALMTLRISYTLVLLSCGIFLLLTYLHTRHLRKPGHQGLTEPVQVAEQNHVPTLTETVKAETRGIIKHNGDRHPENKATQVVAGTEPRGRTWSLAVLLTCVATCLVSVILWRPLFTFDYDFTVDLKEDINNLEQGVQNTSIVQMMLADSLNEGCDVVVVIAREILSKYLNALAALPLAAFRQYLHSIKAEAQASVDTALPLIQVPILLTVYIPLLLLSFGAIVTKIRPAWSVSPLFCSRWLNTVAWLSLAWLTNGALLLITMSQTEVIPLFNVQVHAGGGLPFALAANVILLLASRELRIGAIAPIL